MDPGDILRRSWELYRGHSRHLISIAAVVFVPLGVIAARLALLGWPGVLVANLLDLAAIFLVQGALVKAVEDVARRPALTSAWPRPSATRASASAAGRRRHPGHGRASCVGLPLLIVPGLVLLTWWLVVSPVIVLESAASCDASAAAGRWCAGTAGRCSGWSS